MKVGEILHTIEDYLFWRLAHYFVSTKEYRFLQISKDQRELWLEKKEQKDKQIIRLLRFDLNWSNWMQQDIERTTANGESIRKQIAGRGELAVLNLYISAYPPVDDYESQVEEPFVHPVSKKTVVTSRIIDRETYEDKFRSIEEAFGKSLSIDVTEETVEATTEQVKQQTLATVVNRVKQEKALFESGKPFFTYIFLAAQIILFFLMEIVGSSESTATLIQFGAKFNPLILEGEWWRFFTPIFLHIGFLHLAMNSIALYYFGTIAEKIFGRLRFLFIYLVAGFSGSVASFLISPNLSAGASGAIFGCFGALLYFGYNYPNLFRRTMGVNILSLLVINLVLGFVMPGIDNAGHIGGLIGGFLAAGMVHLPKKKKLVLQMAFLIITIAVTTGFIRYGFEHPSAVLDETSILIMSQEYIHEEQYEKAYLLLSQDVQKGKDSADYYFLLSFAEIQLGYLEDAEKSLLKALELNPAYDIAHFNLALIYLEQGNIEEARLHVEKAIAIDPTKNEYNQLLIEIINASAA